MKTTKILVLIIILILILSSIFLIKKISRNPVTALNICTSGCEEIVYTEANHFGADLLWFGINKDRTNQNALNVFERQAIQLNVDIVRFDVFWALIEPTKGNFDWEITDNLVNSAPLNAKILFTVYSTSPWGVKYSDCRKLGEDLLKERGVDFNFNGPPSSIAEDISDYENFLNKMVGRYKEKVEYWQIENEIYGASTRIESCPPVSRFWLGTEEEYLELLKSSYTTIKSADPSATVFASSYTFEPWPADIKPFFKFILNKGRDFSDLWDLHLYLDPDDNEDKINLVKIEMQNLGYEKKLWATESGEIDIKEYPKFSKSFKSEEELKLQSEEIVKRYASAFGEGIEKVFRLRLTPYKENESPSERFNHMGLTFDANAEDKKPAYLTYKLMQDKLKNFVKVKKLADNVYIFDGDVVVAWSETGKKKINLSPYFPNKVKVTHLNNDKSTETKKSDSIIITESPIFIEGI
jgi:hypothetical protein